MPHLRSLPSQTSKRIVLQGHSGPLLRDRPNEPDREATLQIAWLSASVCAPVNGPEAQQSSIPGWYVRCWEDRKEGEGQDKSEIEWILFTTLPVTDDASAKRLLTWYTYRWQIEEYHKCLKTGCKVEERQLQTAERLSNLLGLLAIVALRLLQLRWLSRQAPDEPVAETVPQLLVALVARQTMRPPAHAMRRGAQGHGNQDAQAYLSASPIKMTNRQFFHAIAKLGGFIGRKSDGEPGWQTLWRGWIRLQDMAWAASVMNNDNPRELS
jgi:hypothetical protein